MADEGDERERDQGRPGAPRGDEAGEEKTARWDREVERIEQERWTTPNQIKDWLVLLLMMVVFIGWGLGVYFFEPGLR
ncbi:MAG TPA: hypothetical protein VE646_02325 [Actinomycetota bacterium]|nr:hypothetical protein [Actinomycetota bacterium]